MREAFWRNHGRWSLLELIYVYYLRVGYMGWIGGEKFRDSLINTYY